LGSNNLGLGNWVSFPGQGYYYPRGRFGQPPLLNVDGQEREQTGYITDELTDYAIRWLEQQKSESNPYLLYLSHKAVHAFFEPAERHLGSYEDMDIKDRTPSLDAIKSEPMWVQNQRNSWHGADYAYHSDLSLVEFQRDYYETLSAVDESLGRLISWLKTNNQLDNTYIVFLSDNGFMFGEHGLIDKRNAFEESMRIPLLIQGPGISRASATEQASVSMLDIAPTLIELAEAETQAPLSGKSLVPFFQGQPDSWSDEIIYEYFWEFNYPHTPTQFAIRDGRWKYVRLHGVWDIDALYDLQNDPGETNNLIANDDYLEIRLDLQTRLHAALDRGDGRAVVPFTYKFNQGAVFRGAEGPEAGDFPERWKRPQQDPERLEHFLPDGPEKAEIQPKVMKAFEENEARIRSN
jgi:arylsulfatase A-like enzyme